LPEHAPPELAQRERRRLERSVALSPKASTRLLATQSDARLVALVRDGHDRAFEALVQRYRAPLLRYCRRLRLSDGRAEDVVQQTLMQAWSALRRGAEVRELRPWLYRIAHNASINLIRDAGRDAAHQAVALDGLPGEGAVSEVRMEPPAELGIPSGLALRETLSDMAALPQMQREVIFRTALAGQSHEEVALTLGITDGAVRGLLYRARATLRGAVTALTPPPLLAWMVSAGQSPTAERIGEMAAGGGVGAGGLLVKGGLAALTATLVAGAAIVHDHLHIAPHSRAAGVKGRVANRLADVPKNGGGLGSGYTSTVARQEWADTSVPNRHRNAAVHTKSRSASGWVRSHPPGTHNHATQTRSAIVEGPSKRGSGTYTVSVTDPAAATPDGSSQTPGGSAGQGGGGGSSSSGGGAAGSSGSGGGGSSGSSGGGTGGGGSGSSGSGGGTSGGTGSGGSGGSGSGGSGSGGSGSGGSGGGGSSGGSGGTGGGSSGGSGSGGSGSSGGGTGGEEPTGSSGGSSGSGESSSGEAKSAGSPVGTIVHEVTNVLESTVSGLLGR
jgi:RNA polymerase sigma factor (sigma-70 family)